MSNIFVLKHSQSNIFMLFNLSLITEHTSQMRHLHLQLPRGVVVVTGSFRPHRGAVLVRTVPS